MTWNKKKYTPEQLREYYRNYYKEKRAKKLSEERAENPVYKICTMCGEKFIAKRNQKYCCEACSNLAAKIRQKILRQKDSYKQSQIKYRNSEKYKETRAKYFQSEHGQETRKKYLQSENAKETRKKYSQSIKGKQTSKRYYLKRKANGGLPLSQTPKKVNKKK